MVADCTVQRAGLEGILKQVECRYRFSEDDPNLSARRSGQAKRMFEGHHVVVLCRKSSDSMRVITSYPRRSSFLTHADPKTALFLWMLDSSLVVAGHHEDLNRSRQGLNSSIAEIRFVWDRGGVPAMEGRNTAVEMGIVRRTAEKSLSTATWSALLRRLCCMDTQMRSRSPNAMRLNSLVRKPIVAGDRYLSDPRLGFADGCRLPHPLHAHCAHVTIGGAGAPVDNRAREDIANSASTLRPRATWLSSGPMSAKKPMRQLSAASRNRPSSPTGRSTLVGRRWRRRLVSARSAYLLCRH